MCQILLFYNFIMPVCFRCNCYSLVFGIVIGITALRIEKTLEGARPFNSLVSFSVKAFSKAAFFHYCNSF